MFCFYFWNPMLVRPAVKRLFCLKAKKGFGRFAPSALPHYNVPQKQLRDPSATRSTETARPRQVPPTQQPSQSPTKERASQPNSASDDFSKLLSRTWQEITTFSVGSTVERPILDREHQLNLPVSAFSIFSAVRVLYYCTRMVGSWVVDG